MSFRRAWLTSLLIFVAAAHGADKKQPPDPRVPIALDEIHYYLTDPSRAVLFLETHFGARKVDQPYKFVTQLSLEPNEGSLQISPPGPFDGVTEIEPKTWLKDFVPPAVNLPSRYGIYWVGIRSSNFKKDVERIEARGVTVQERSIILPIDPRAKATSVYGPDYNVFVLVDRAHHRNSGPFGLDHVQLLVKNVADNVNFFRDVLSATVLGQSEHEANIIVAGFAIAISDPEGLDLNRAEIQERNPAQFRFEADHLGFLFTDIHPAVEAAKAKGRKFSIEPRRFEYFGKPGRETYAVIETPDHLPIYLVMKEK